jgi:hypothetical protein
MTTARPADPPRPTRFRPWRWEWPAWAIAAAALAFGVPIFLRMPPWCDLTLYDMAARAVMTGGVHYRDVFDTNNPGFVWLLVLIRRTLGPSTEAVRAVDLAIVTVCVLVLLKLAKRAGADRLGRAWFVAGAAAFYPFTTEFNHAQRDVWMLLPALAAVSLRLNRPPTRAFRRSFVEGLLWGAAVWIKPHVVFPAVAVWLASARRFTADGRWRSTRGDFLGNLLGGLVMGTAGLAWLVATGTWPYFADVFTRWNPHYTEYIFAEMGWRALSHSFHFVPWTFLQPLVAFLAVCDLAAAKRGGPARWLGRVPRWWFTPAADPDARAVRAVLGALFLGWVFQSFVLQRQFPYAHVAETLVAFAILAAHRWAVVPLGLAYLAVTSAVFFGYENDSRVRGAVDRVERAAPWLWRYTPLWNYLPQHPMTDPKLWAAWPTCWDSLSGPAYDRRQDALAQLKGSFPSISVEEANEVAAWLRDRGATAETVVCWHSSPHAVYLGLPGRPAFRFMHVDTPLIRRTTYGWMREELVRDALPKAKYVVSDVYRLFVGAPPEAYQQIGSARADLLPEPVPAVAKTLFPYNQPAVFRSGGGRGRYVVHELKNPVEPVEYDEDGFNVWHGK